MYQYPIYKHLIQFSNLVDDKGELKSISENINLPSSTPAGAALEAARKAEKKDESDLKDSEENEGGEREPTAQYEGGDPDQDSSEHKDGNAGAYNYQSFNQ